MLRDYKYKPVRIRYYCPVCGLEVTEIEWCDYGMHAGCCGIPNEGIIKESNDDKEKVDYVSYNRLLNSRRTNV